VASWLTSVVGLEVVFKATRPIQLVFFVFAANRDVRWFLQVLFMLLNLSCLVQIVGILHDDCRPVLDGIRLDKLDSALQAALHRSKRLADSCAVQLVLLHLHCCLNVARVLLCCLLHQLELLLVLYIFHYF